jgi:hypothetical protein
MALLSRELVTRYAFMDVEQGARRLTFAYRQEHDGCHPAPDVRRTRCSDDGKAEAYAERTGNLE